MKTGSFEIHGLEGLASRAIFHRRMGHKIALTTGVFDLKHDGHVFYLYDAAQLGDVLFVGVDSDARVKASKGKDRPIHNEDIRVMNVVSQRGVDYAGIFDDQDKLIEAVNPHVIVASPTFKDDPEMKRFNEAKKAGIEIHMVESRSLVTTTSIIAKIRVIYGLR